MIRFTKKGFEKLKKDYEEAIKMRPIAVADLKKARDMGDLSENGYYKAARFKLSQIDYLIRKLKNDIRSAIVIETSGSDFVGIGNIVTLSNEKTKITYEVVGDLEANPDEKKISLLSPIGKAIKDRRVDENVFIETPTGKISYTITKIS